MTVLAWIIVLTQMIMIFMAGAMCLSFLKRIRALHHGWPLLLGFVTAFIKRSYELWIGHSALLTEQAIISSIFIVTVYGFALWGFAALYSLDIHRHSVLTKTMKGDVLR
jgi:hypothetical protein